jgi:hypothetical protein
VFGLVAAGNRGDLDAARRLCSDGFLRRDSLRIERGGGVTGLPRTIDPNFKAWRHGPHVWICPTDRVGPVYQVIQEGGVWKFDGLVGLRQPGGTILPAPAGGSD